MSDNPRNIGKKVVGSGVLVPVRRKGMKASLPENNSRILTLEEALETIEHMDKRIKQLVREQRGLLFSIAQKIRTIDRLKDLLERGKHVE